MAWSRERRLNSKLNTYAKYADHGKGECLKLFQKMRRMQEANHHGVCKCISCPAVRRFNEMDGGHYISRKHNATAFEPQNVHPQCKKCNSSASWGLSGNTAEYRKALPEGVADYLESKSREIKQFSKHDYAEMALEFEDQIEIEKERLGV